MFASWRQHLVKSFFRYFESMKTKKAVAAAH